jgi:serine/threonine protein kinase
LGAAGPPGLPCNRSGDADMAKETTKYCPRCFEAFGQGGDICPEHDLKLIALVGSGEGLEGEVIDDKYEIIDVLGKGGMGTVYRARHMIIGREVALKVLRNDYLEDHKGVARFVREARAASRLKSRYSAMLHDFGLAPQGFLYYTMELASGRLLSDIVDRDGALGPERTMHIAADICHSLSEAHANNIVHRDIKADNIMISQDPDGHEIGKVLDFGTAKLINTRERSTRVTDPGIVCGTPEYMSPEQAQALPVDGRSDLYSLGVLMFEMLTGKLPFTAANSVAVLLKHVNDEPPSPRSILPTLPKLPGLENLIGRLLAKDIEERPRTAVAVLRELQKYLEGLTAETGEGGTDLSAHASFELELGIEEAYRTPRGDTLISMMDSGTAPRLGSGGRPRAQQTMEIAPGNLWREKKVVKEELNWGEVRSPTSEEEMRVVDTVHIDEVGESAALVDTGETMALEEFIEEPRSIPTPSAAVLATVKAAGESRPTGGDGDFEYVQLASISVEDTPPISASPVRDGKLRELPSDVLRGVEAAAEAVKPDRSGAAKWIFVFGGVAIGAATFLALFLNGALDTFTMSERHQEKTGGIAASPADATTSPDVMETTGPAGNSEAVAQVEDVVPERNSVTSLLSDSDRNLLEKQVAAASKSEPIPVQEVEPVVRAEAAPLALEPQPAIATADVVEEPGPAAVTESVAPVVKKEPAAKEAKKEPAVPSEPGKKHPKKKEPRKKQPKGGDSGGFNLDDLH